MLFDSLLAIESFSRSLRDDSCFSLHWEVPPDIQTLGRKVWEVHQERMQSPCISLVSVLKEVLQFVGKCESQTYISGTGSSVQVNHAFKLRPIFPFRYPENRIMNPLEREYRVAVAILFW